MTALAVDTETTGLRLHAHDKPFAVFACDENGDGYQYEWPVDPFTRSPLIPRKDRAELVDILHSYDELVFHNITFDVRALYKVGIKFKWVGKSHDTGVMGHVLHNIKTKQLNSRLKPMSEAFVGIPADDEKRLHDAVVKARRIGKKQKWNLGSKVEEDYWLPAVCVAQGLCKPEDRDLFLSALGVYGFRDVERTISLFKYFKQGLEIEGLWKVYEGERRLFPVCYSMMQRGISILPDRLHEEIGKREDRISTALRVLRKQADDPYFNPRSTGQLKSILFDRLKFRPTKYTKTGPSTDKTVIAALNDQAKSPKQRKFIEALTQHRKAGTALGYLKEYEKESYEDRIYYSIKQNGTSTTRFSSSNPNSQNVGKGEDQIDEEGNPIIVDSLRAVYGPSKGRVWLAMDYSQLQLRIFAYVSEEPSLIKAFEEGWDAHDYMAHRIYKLSDDEKPSKLQRRVAKAVNFGFIFGAQPEKIELTAGISGLWGTVTSMFPNAHDYMMRIKRQVYKYGYVETASGYRLYLPYRHGKVAAHAGVNYIVQGTEGDIVKEAMVQNHTYLKTIASSFSRESKPFITLQVHDEIIYDFPKLPHKKLNRYGKALKSRMEEAGDRLGIRTPVDAELITTSWDNGKDINFDERK